MRATATQLRPPRIGGDASSSPVTPPLTTAERVLVPAVWGVATLVSAAWVVLVLALVLWML